MIRPGHLPKLESHIAKAITSIQKLPEADREMLQAVLTPMRALLFEQSAFNRRIADSLEDTAESAEEVTESLVPFFMFTGS